MAATTTTLAAVFAPLQHLVIELDLLGRRRQAPLQPPFENIDPLLAGFEGRFGLQQIEPADPVRQGERDPLLAAGQGVEGAPQGLDETARVGDVRLSAGKLQAPASASRRTPARRTAGRLRCRATAVSCSASRSSPT